MKVTRNSVTIPQYKKPKCRSIILILVRFIYLWHIHTEFYYGSWNWIKIRESLMTLADQRIWSWHRNLKLWLLFSLNDAFRFELKDITSLCLLMMRLNLNQENISVSLNDAREFKLKNMVKCDKLRMYDNSSFWIELKQCAK